jgi:hypothetical protein
MLEPDIGFFKSCSAYHYIIKLMRPKSQFLLLFTSFLRENLSVQVFPLLLLSALYPLLSTSFSNTLSTSPLTLYFLLSPLHFLLTTFSSSLSPLPAPLSTFSSSLSPLSSLLIPLHFLLSTFPPSI